MVSSLVALLPAVAAAQFAIMPPPTTGPYAYYPPYGTFGPDQPGFLAVGQSYVDPVFGSTIRRLSNAYPGSGDALLYARNGFWNADGTRFAHNPDLRGTVDFIDTTTGATVCTGVDPSDADATFDPVNPDAWYYFSGASLMQYSVSSCRTVATVKTFAGPLGSVGGHLEEVDAAGRYWVLNIGGSLQAWDKQTDTLYTGTFPATFGKGYVGMAPDGSGVIEANDSSGQIQILWHALNHTAQTMDATGVVICATCGDHGDLVSASDGKTYFVTGLSQQAHPFIVAIDMTGVVRTLFDMATWCNDCAVNAGGIARANMATPPTERTRARAPATSERNRLSVSTWRTTRRGKCISNGLDSAKTGTPFFAWRAYFSSVSREVSRRAFCNTPAMGARRK